MKKGLPNSRPFCDVSDLLVQAELLVELGNASAGIDQLLLAGVERMALAANFNADLRLGIAGMDHVAACAGNGAIHIVGMNTLLHFHFTSFSIMTKGSHT